MLRAAGETSAAAAKHFAGVALKNAPYLPAREFFIDNLLVRIHLIIGMILVDRPCAMEFEFLFSGILISTFLVPAI